MCNVDWGLLADVLAEDPGVVAAWVFGSAREGALRPGGDLDIGVFFATRPALAERAELRARLQESLAVDAIDLVVLNDAGPLLTFEVVSGRAVFCRDRGRRAEFVSLGAREYEDEMAVLQRGLQYWDERHCRRRDGC